MKRRIVSVWLPRLSTDRLNRDGKGAWAERPLAAIEEIGGRAVIVAVNAVAEAEGTVPGMSLADARALCPALAAVPRDGHADAQALDRLAGWCERYTPWVAVDGTDGLVLDVTGCAHLMGGETALLRDLGRRLRARGLTVRTALAATPGAARALARCGRDGVVVPADGTRAALADLAVEGLSIAPDVQATLHKLGLRTFGALLPLPRASLAARFGRDLVFRLDRALGVEDEPISPRPFVPPFRERLGFAEPIGTPEDIERGLDVLLERLCRRLGRAGRGCRRLVFTARRVDGTENSVYAGTASAVRDPDHLQRRLRPTGRPSPPASPGWSTGWAAGWGWTASSGWCRSKAICRTGRFVRNRPVPRCLLGPPGRARRRARPVCWPGPSRSTPSPRWTRATPAPRPACSAGAGGVTASAPLKGPSAWRPSGGAPTAGRTGCRAGAIISGSRTKPGRGSGSSGPAFAGRRRDRHRAGTCTGFSRETRLSKRRYSLTKKPTRIRAHDFGTHAPSGAGLERSENRRADLLQAGSHLSGVPEDRGRERHDLVVLRNRAGGGQPAAGAARACRHPAPGLHARAAAFRLRGRQPRGGRRAVPPVAEHAGHRAGSPSEYDYSPGYYAVFFADPDGIKFELVHMPPPGGG